MDIIEAVEILAMFLIPEYETLKHLFLGIELYRLEMYWVVLEMGIDIYAPIDNLIACSIMLSRRIPEDALKNYEILRKIIDLHIAIAVVTMQFADWVICRNRDVYHVANTIVSISRLVNRINAIKELDFAKQIVR